MVKKFSE